MLDYYPLDTQDKRIIPVEYPSEISSDKRYFRLNTLLGRGKFKTVYKAIDREEGYEVAWNITDTYKNFSHEVELLKSIRHPNIIAFHDAWMSENESELIFITELMTSGTLRQYIQKLNLPNLKVIKRWSRQILKGLAYLHSHSPAIVHRDIKCDNIFVNGAHGEVKIGDLGTADTICSGVKKHTMIGTPEFMAPEMYEEGGYNEKVDLYAFGMCLIEMMTGDYPYKECTNAAQVYKKVSQNIKPESITKIQNQQAVDIVNSCLASNENDRSSAQELLEFPFLVIEPDVILLSSDIFKTGDVLLQVVFKGSNRRAVKFRFNIHKDTVEDLLSEMIEEHVIPRKHGEWIKNEINRILKDLTENKDDYEDQQSMTWRRECDFKNQLEDSRKELLSLQMTLLEKEKKCLNLIQQAVHAEEKEQKAFHDLEKAMSNKLQYEEMVLSDSESSFNETLLNGLGSKVYSDQTPIDEFVKDTCRATRRGSAKAKEWSEKLKNQDILFVGDLRELVDEDWAKIDLTIFAIRALKNMAQK